VRENRQAVTVQSRIVRSAIADDVAHADGALFRVVRESVAADDSGNTADR